MLPHFTLIFQFYKMCEKYFWKIFMDNYIDDAEF